MNDPIAQQMAFFRWYRWVVLVLISSGAALWIATGNWQWILLPFSIMCLVAFTYVSLLPAEAVAALAPGRSGADFTRGERLTETAGAFVFLAGINAWAWRGEWQSALIGGTVWATAAVGMRMHASRRRARQYEEAVGLSRQAEQFMDEGRFGQGAAAYEQLMADTIGTSPQTDSLVTAALYSRALDLDRKGRREEAIEAYVEVLARCTVVSTTTTAEMVLHIRRRLRELRG